MTGIRIAGSVAALGALLLAAGCTRDGTAAGTTAAGATDSPAPPTAGTDPLESRFVSVVRTALPSVVEVRTPDGLGSGVVYDDRGDIVTNAHVVGTATTFQVRLATSSQSYPATLVGSFPQGDLAVVRVQGATGLRPAKFGDSGRLQAGMIVLAMGNPLGLDSSVTNGIVSAVGRTVSEPQTAGSPGAVLPDAIQTSASINPGNSGGALVNLASEVIGIPTLAAVNQEAGGGAPAAGIGFAIPSNTVRRIADQLVKSGKVTSAGRAALGVVVSTVAGPDGQPVGVGVQSVTPGGPAAAAGVKPGDVITAVDQTPVTDTQSLQDVLAAHQPGQRVTLTIIRAGSTIKVTVTLGELRAS
jgi:S1-C subfamily serine protease